ncbi:MAG: helix-turn-helix domain-containing protein [Streptosporangiaceae bacterium]
MPVVARRPGPPLDGLVTAITCRYGEQPHASVEKILPSAETGLWVNLNRDAFRSFGDDGRIRRVPGAMLAGPSSRAAAFEFEQGHAHVAVSFALGGAGRFFAAPLRLAADELVPLEVLWGRAGASLRERLLEAGTPDNMLDVMEGVLRQHLAGTLSPDPAVLAAAGALSRGARVTQAAEDLALLPRTLRRRFTAEVGLGPKRFGRVQRMQRLVRDLDGRTEVDWATTAADHGYADQPHLADEFRDLAGVTATEYLRSRINGPNHLRFPGLPEFSGPPDPAGL